MKVGGQFPEYERVTHEMVSTQRVGSGEQL